MRRVIWLGTIMLAFASLASAQIPTGGNIFVGYSFENTSSAAVSFSRPNLQGWEASLEGKIFPFVGIVADFSGHYGNETFTVLSPEGPIALTNSVHEDEVFFGPRVSVRIGKFTPFGEGMVGLAHINGGLGQGTSETAFASAVGGGLDYKIVRPLALRVEADYIRTSFFSTNQNNLRLSTGVVFRF